MRSLWRTLDPETLRGILTITGSAAISGASFGAIAVATGQPLWVPITMSALVFAGGSQFLAVGVLAGGGGPVAAVLGGLVLNARHLPFGLAVGHLVGRGRVARLVGSHLLVDESVAFALAQRDPGQARAALWGCGAGLFAGWNLGTVLGALVGDLIADPAALGLDVVFPVLLLALVLPVLTGSQRHGKLRPVLVGAVVALATTPFLPAGVPVLLSLAGLVVLIPAPKKKEEVAA